MNLRARLTRLEQRTPKQADNPYRHMSDAELEAVAQRLFERDGGSGPFTREWMRALIREHTRT